MEPTLNQSGISIVEICIATLIIAITAIVITFFSKNSLNMYRDSYGAESAYIAAENKLADLTAAPYPVDGSDNVTIDHITYARQWVLTNIGSVTRAEITVSWLISSGNRQITLMGAVN